MSSDWNYKQMHKSVGGSRKTIFWFMDYTGYELHDN